MRTIYLGRDNTFDLILSANGSPVNASQFDRFVLYLRNKKNGTTVTIDSSTAPAGTFSSANQVFYKDAKYASLRCLLGLGSFGLVAGLYEAWLRVYNGTYTNGLVWPDHDDSIRIKVDSGP